MPTQHERFFPKCISLPAFLEDKVSDTSSPSEWVTLREDPQMPSPLELFFPKYKDLHALLKDKVNDTFLPSKWVTLREDPTINGCLYDFLGSILGDHLYLCQRRNKDLKRVLKDMFRWILKWRSRDGEWRNDGEWTTDDGEILDERTIFKGLVDKMDAAYLKGRSDDSKWGRMHRILCWTREGSWIPPLTGGAGFPLWREELGSPFDERRELVEIV